MAEITTRIIEQPGSISKVKAQALTRMIQQFYLSAPPELRAEIDKRAEELRKRKETSA